MTDEQLDKIEWLNRAFRIDKKVTALLAVQEQNRSLACRCTASYENDGTSSGSHSNSQEAILHKICDGSIEIQQMIDYLADVRKEIFDTISSVGDDDLEAILFQRYLAYKSIQEIAESMHYDRKTIQRKHAKALDKISNKIANIVDINVK